MEVVLDVNVFVSAVLSGAGPSAPSEEIVVSAATLVDLWYVTPR